VWRWFRLARIRYEWPSVYRLIPKKERTIAAPLLA
jgi:hypothetical protein